MRTKTYAKQVVFIKLPIAIDTIKDTVFYMYVHISYAENGWNFLVHDSF